MLWKKERRQRSNRVLQRDSVRNGPRFKFPPCLQHLKPREDFIQLSLSHSFLVPHSLSSSVSASSSYPTDLLPLSQLVKGKPDECSHGKPVHHPNAPHTHTCSFTYGGRRFTMSEKANVEVENSPLPSDVWTFSQYATVRRIAQCTFSLRRSLTA